MVKESEGTFVVGDATLYTKTWLPDDTVPTVAKLILIHGFSDHINRYYDLFPTLAARGIATYGFDQRGWGRSVHKPADKGRTGPTAQVIAEVAAFVQSQLPSPQPLFVLGHSMGGGEMLTLASSAAHDDLIAQVRGWIAEAPFIGWPAGETPSALKVWGGRLVGKVLPHRHLMHIIPPERLSRDPEVVKSLREDKLCHDTGTLEGLAGVLDRTGDLLSGKAVLRPGVRSLWLGHGTADLGTSYEASKAWFERQKGLEDKTFRTYEGWYHQLHAEPEREVFYKEVGDWILARSGQEAKAGAEVAAVVGAAPPAPSAVETVEAAKGVETTGEGETSAEAKEEGKPEGAEGSAAKTEAKL